VLQSRVILAYMPKASNPDIVAGCIRKVGRSLSSDVIRTRFLNTHPKFVDDDDMLRFELRSCRRTTRGIRQEQVLASEVNRRSALRVDFGVVLKADRPSSRAMPLHEGKIVPPISNSQPVRHSPPMFKVELKFQNCGS
jgi:hypothetical protein